MTTVAAVYGMTVPQSVTNIPSPDLAAPALRVGVEAELEHARHVEYVPLWNQVEEGSLHSGGTEFVFCQPLLGEDIIEALRCLEEAYTYEPPYLSGDASLHVHIDVRMLTIDQLFKFLCLAYMFEPLMMDTYCPTRTGNIFCQQLHDNQGLLAQTARAMRYIGHSDPSLPMESKYGNINLLSLQTFGSVEFRGHGPEYKAEPILEWVNVLMCIHNACHSMDLDTRRPYMDFKHLPVNEVLHRVFGKYGSKMVRNLNKKALLRRGMQNVRALTVARRIGE